MRSLSTGEVGLFNLSFTVAGLVGLVMLFGLDRSIVRYVAYYLGTEDRSREVGVILSAISLLLLLILIITPLFWFGAHTVARSIFHKPELTPVLKVFVLSVPFVALTRLFMGIFQGYKRVVPIALIEQMSVPLLRIIGVITIVLAFAQTSKLISYSFLIASVIGCILAAIVILQLLVKRARKTHPIFTYSKLVNYSWPLFGASLLNRTNTYTETLILGMLSSNREIGIFTVSFKVAFTLTIIFHALNSILAPFIAEVYAEENMNKLAYQFKAVTRWILMLTLPITLVMFLEASDIMSVLKPEYVAGTPILQMLTLSHLVSVAVGPVALILTMTRYARLNLIDLFLTLVLSLVLDFALIPKYGAYGAAVAGAVAVVFLNILRLIQVYVIFGIQPYNWHTLKTIAAGGLASMVTLVGKQLLQQAPAIWRLLVLAILFLSTYGILMVTLFRNEADSEILTVLFQSLFNRKRRNVESRNV